MDRELINKAAWIDSAKVHPFHVRAGPNPDPADREVVIKVAYAAVNPTDYKMQDEPYLELPYPFIFGTDVAGTVVQLGHRVTKFEIGQRVIGHCDSLLSGKSTNAGFQLYSTCREGLVCAIPDDIPLSHAAVLPLGVDTAAGALFHILALPLPSSDIKPAGKTILVWGGSSSVGSCAIQLAVAAGLRVIATTGAPNFEYVKCLGASEVFDHRAKNVLEQVKHALKTGDVIVDCIGIPETQRCCAEILDFIGGGPLPIVLSPSGEFPESVRPVMVNGLAVGFTSDELGAWGPGAAHIGRTIWHEFMPDALRTGRFQAKPDAFVIERGLEKVQEGVDMLRKGVSAQKIVIQIGE